MKMKEKRYMGRELRVLDNLIKRFIDNQMNGVQIDRITGSNGWIIAYLRDHPSGPLQFFHELVQLLKPNSILGEL